MALAGGVIVGLLSISGVISVKMLKRKIADYLLRLWAILLAAAVSGILLEGYSGVFWVFYVLWCRRWGCCKCAEIFQYTYLTFR
jgi:hypothetical protein